MTELEAARIKLKCLEMVECTELEWTAVIRHKPHKEPLNNVLDVYCPQHVETALDIVEGKPVWKGDTLWHCNRKFIADMDLPDYISYMKNPNELSWNPPKPKTVMVELLVDDAKAYVTRLAAVVGLDCADGRLVSACRKALEILK